MFCSESSDISKLIGLLIGLRINSEMVMLETSAYKCAGSTSDEDNECGKIGGGVGQGVACIINDGGIVGGRIKWQGPIDREREGLHLTSAYCPTMRKEVVRRSKR
jgi:hypothetical protein